jgi:hypothetical protein
VTIRQLSIDNRRTAAPVRPQRLQRLEERTALVVENGTTSDGSLPGAHPVLVLVGPPSFHFGGDSTSRVSRTISDVVRDERSRAQMPTIPSTFDESTSQNRSAARLGRVRSAAAELHGGARGLRSVIIAGRAEQSDVFADSPDEMDSLTNASADAMREMPRHDAVTAAAGDRERSNRRPRFAAICSRPALNGPRATSDELPRILVDKREQLLPFTPRAASRARGR